MTLFQPIPLVLASGSAIRAQMLKGCGLSFSVAPSNVDEEAMKREFLAPHPNPLPKGEGTRSTSPLGRGQNSAAILGEGKYEQLAAKLASAKALNVSASYPEHLTIGADQLCVLGESIFDKPMTKAAAIQQLQQLSGRTHQQISAVCIARGEDVLWQAVEVAELTMRTLTLADIEAYINADEPLKSCGAYKYESLGKHLFASVSGTDSAIKGLPLQPLIAQLHGVGAISLTP